MKYTSMGVSLNILKLIIARLALTNYLVDDLKRPV